MDQTNRSIFTLFLLSAVAVLSEVQAMGQTLDVCATCHADATCEEKSDGSGKVCNCKYGFLGNGRTFCQDKDECQIGSSMICGQHTTCHNTYGSYYCTCLAGYSPSNNKAIFIPNDGTHCQDIDECRVTGLCGEGGQCRNLDGSFDCSCEPGYRVHDGDEPFHPQTDEASCRVVDCGRPPSVQGSVLHAAMGTTYGSVATFGCGEGFLWRRGDNTSVCGADGLWRGPTMVCEEVHCGSPPALPHSHMLWNKSSAMGAEVVYRCDSGYRNVGEGDASVCTAAGRWTMPSVLCQEITCGIPPLIKSTEQVWSGNSSPGSAVLYSCKKGFYNKGGNNVSRCDENGLWTPPTLSCQEILCGDPPTLPHTGQEWNGSSTPGSAVTYYCKRGFNDNGGNHTSLCTINGYWTKPGISCKEVDCGVPPAVPHSVTLWDQTSTLDSQVVYRCKFGFQSVGERNASVCAASGRWEGASLICQEISCGPPLTPPHTNVLRGRGGSRVGGVLLYECTEGFYQESGNALSTCSQSGEWGEVSIKCKAKCGPVPLLAHSEVLWNNESVAIHRCVDGHHSWRGTNVSVCDSTGTWQKATLRCIEIKPAINHLIVLNEKCLQWKAEKYEEDTEVYKVKYSGRRDYQRSFRDERKRFLSSNSELLELCLNLLPLTNYSISITAVSARFTATITTNTSLTAPQTPFVKYREFDDPAPSLSLRRPANTLDPISVYQVFVLPVERIMVFDCSSPGGLDLSTQGQYLTAQIHVRHLGAELNFTVGDGLYYGGFFNAPLENGRNYYIILRAVSQWKTALKSSCVLWAKVNGTSYILRVSSLSAAASVGLVAMVAICGYSCTWFFKKT